MELFEGGQVGDLGGNGFDEFVRLHIQHLQLHQITDIRRDPPSQIITGQFHPCDPPLGDRDAVPGINRPG